MTGPDSPTRPGPARARLATRRALIVLVVLTAAFVALTVAVAVRWGPLISLDGSVEGAVHGFAVTHRGLLPAVGVVTDLGSPVAMNIVVLVAAIALVSTRRVRAAVYLVAARFLELGVETLLKDVVARPRPAWVDPVGSATSTSFPSGHSAGTAVVYLALIVLGVVSVGRPRRSSTRALIAVGVVAGAVLLVLVPVSRVVLGVHFPSDVVGGVLLGLVCALLLVPILRGARAARPR